MPIKKVEHGMVVAKKRNEDNLNKIFRFKDIPIIIFNHGVNKVNNKFWDTYCSDYELSNKWKGKSLKEIALDFKEFVEKELLRQLSQNAINFPGNKNVTVSAFVVCGKDLSNNRFEFYELHWSHKLSFSSWADTRLIGSGEGYEKYLDDYLRKHPQSNSIEFWGSIDTTKAKEELKKLFQ